MDLQSLTPILKYTLPPGGRYNKQIDEEMENFIQRGRNQA